MPTAQQNSQGEEAVKSASKASLTKLILIILVLVLAGGFAWSFYSYRQVQMQLDQVANQRLSEKEIATLISKVGKHIVLPADQEPTIATVQDASALAEQQPFFKDANNGDTLFIYNDRAILYRESKDVIINVGPVSIQSKDAQDQPTEENAF
jgi:uncharacterized protein YneF (UPF0154 family)